MPTELIISWNDLSRNPKLRIGQQLSLYISQNDKASQPVKPITVASNSQKDDKVIILATQTKKFPKTVANSTVTASNIETPEKMQRSWYKVQNGDTIWTIAKELKLSPLQIKQWNNLQTNTIHPGKRFKIKDV